MASPLPDQQMRFGYLDGAGIAARAIGEWALASGFGDDNVRIVTDEPIRGKANPVTRERVQQAVNQLFPPRAEVVGHLIVAFCGHGLTDASFGSISWLFSDSLLGKYRVIATEFYGELLYHGVQRITLISDACREAPKDIDLMRLDAVRGIVVQGTRPDRPKVDRFAACQDGQLGFMVSEPNSAKPGKCVFSGVIADVLWGIEPAAIENDVITTTTLGKYLPERTEQRANDYHLKLYPDCYVNAEAMVLYDKAKPLSAWPGLQPWPTAEAAIVLGTPGVTAGASDGNLERVRTDENFRRRILGPDFGLNRFSMTVSDKSLRIPDHSKDLLEDLVALRTSPPATTRRGAASGNDQKVKVLRQRLEADAVADARKRAAEQVRRSLVQIRPSEGPDGSNLIVSGMGAKLWSRNPVDQGRLTSARAGFRVGSDAQGTPILVQLADGSFTPVVPYAGLYALVKQSEAGEVVQAYGQQDAREDFKVALESLADFAAGRISAGRVDELAGRVRHEKHADPSLGAICAYLYRAIADVDSIRRMAYFYVRHDQPVPFDIALLGAMKVTREVNGALRLQVPAVKARERRDGDVDLPDFVTAATPATEAWIGGRCPWLALGWDYVGLPRPEWAPLVDGLADHAREVRRSGFTVLPNEVGVVLAAAWNLQPR